MRKKFSILKLLFGLVTIVIGGLLALPFLINFETYRTDITQAIAISTGQQVVIRGDIQGSFLPLPTIKATDVFISSQSDANEGKSSLTTIKELDAELDIFSLLAGKTKISAITMIQPNINSKVLNDIYNNWLNADETEETSGASVSAAPINLKEIVIENGEMYSRDEVDYSIRKIEDVNATVSIGSLTGPFLVNGSFYMKGNRFAFDANIGSSEDGEEGESESVWNFYGDGFTISFMGDFFEVDGHSVLKGDITTNIADLEFFVGKYFYNKEIERTENEDEDKQAENPRIPFSINGKLNYSRKHINIDNIVVTSPAVEGKGSIEALMEIGVPQIDISLLFDRINMDKILLKEEKVEKKEEDESVISAELFIEEQKNTESAYEKISNVIGDLFHNVNMLTDITVNELTYHNESTKKLILNADMFRGDMVIHELTAIMPGNTLVEVNGTIKHNMIRPRFNGEVLVSGDSLRQLLQWQGVDVSFVPKTLLGKFKANGDITLLPQKIHLYGVDITVDEAQAEGEITIRKGSETSKVTSSLHVGNVDFDLYKAAPKVMEVVKKYYYGEEGNRYTQNFSWLRSHKGYFLSEVFFEHFKLNNHIFDNASMMFILNPGSVKVQSLTVASKDLKIASNAQIDITGLRPILNFDLDAQKIDTSVLGIKPVSEKNTKPQRFTWSQEPFNFLGLDRFDGRIKVKAESISHGKNMAFKDLVFNSDLEEGVLTIKKFSMGIGKGNTVASGTLIIEGEPILSLSLAINNVLATPFLKYLGLDNISGYMSVSGSVATRGNTFAKWVENAASSATLAARSVKVGGFGLHDFIEQSEPLTTASQVEKLKNLASTIGETEFSSIDGTFTVKEGTINIPRFDVSTRRTRGLITGAVDLVRSTLHLIGRFAYITVAEGRTVTLGYDVQGLVFKNTRTLDVTQFMQLRGISTVPEKQEDIYRRRR